MTTSARPEVAFFLPSLYGGGAERVVLNLAEGFAARGLRTDLVLAKAEGHFLDSVTPRVRVVDLKASRVLTSLRPLVGYLKRERPVVLAAALDHANLVAMAASRLAGAGTRIVIAVHCTFEKGDHAKRDVRLRVLPWLLGRFHHWADAVVAVSEGVARDVVQTAGIPRDRVSVIPNPVITPGLLPAAAERPAHPWLEDPQYPVVLGVGRLAAQKNFPLLIEAFAAMGPDIRARLVILGEGPERPRLEAEIRRYGLEDRVALAGFVQNPYACMARAQVFVLSSDYEGLPTVLIECLALGTPVVATDCESGPREILQDGALGALVPVGDVRALSQAIARAVSMPRSAPPLEALRPFTLDAALDRFQTVLNPHA